MSNKSTFEGLFDERLNHMPPSADRNETRPVSQQAKPGREPGKRSNPEFRQYSVLLKKRTHMEVSHMLDILGGAQDMSELVQQLLEQWLKRLHRKSVNTE